jgi:membrane protein DedA with SNARE-associated domain
VWATAVVLAGYLLGQGWFSAQNWPERSPLLLVLLLLLAPGVYLTYRWVTSHKSN